MTTNDYLTLLTGPWARLVAWFGLCMVTPFWLCHIRAGALKWTVYLITMPCFFIGVLILNLSKALLIYGLSGFTDTILSLPKEYTLEYLSALSEMSPAAIKQERLMDAWREKQIAEIRKNRISGSDQHPES